MKTKPPRYQHQQDVLDLNPDKYLLPWGCGCAKTRGVIELVEQKTFDVLVIVPKALVANWKREIEKWSNGTTAYNVMTKENFKKHVQTIRRYDAVVVDEAHFFAGRTSQMSKALKWYLTGGAIEYVYLLTATPFLSNPWNVYRLAEMLGEKWSYQGFEQDFFQLVRMGPRMIPVIRKGTEPLLADYVAKLGKAVELEDAVDVPADNMVKEYFELNKKQEKAMSEDYDSIPLVRFTKEHQICGGTIKGDEYTDDKIIPSDKRDRVIGLAEEHKKLIIVCRYNLELAALAVELDKKKYNVFVINGQVKDRDAVLQEARKKDNFILLVNAACSEGWECPEVETMVFYSYDFSLKNYIQMKGRIQRINKIERRTYLSLLYKGTVDEEVYRCLKRKQDFHLHIYAKKMTTLTKP